MAAAELHSTAEYLYHAVDGTVVGCVTHDATTGQRLLWKQSSAGAWMAATRPLPPYRLPELVDARAVVGKERRFVLVAFRDEAGADRLIAEGFIATTFATPEGQSPFPEEWIRHFRDARVVVLHRSEDAAAVHGLGNVIDNSYAAEVRLVDLGELGVVEWLDAHSAAQLRKLVERTRPYDFKADYLELHPEPPAPNGHAATRRFQLVRIDDFLAEEAAAVDMIVDGLVPAGGFVVIGAKPKVGKSTLARTLAVAIARGQTCLGRATKAGGVLYLALEDKRDFLREQMRLAGARDSDPIHIHCARAPEDALVALREAIEEHRPSVVFIDTLFRFLRVSDTSSYAEVNAALEGIVELARQTGCAIVVVHHNRKADGEGGDQLLGSTAIFAAADTAILMRRREDDVRIVETEQRYGVDMGATVITLDDCGRTQLGMSLGDYEHAQVGRQILEVLLDGPRAEADIREACHVHAMKVSRVLRALVGNGTVRRDGEGKRGSPYIYSLPPGPQPDWMPRAVSS